MKQWIPYDNEKIEFDIPEENLAWVVSPKHVPGCADEKREVEHAILNPIGSASLKDILGDPHGKTVAVVVDDNTRVTPAEKLLLPLAELLGKYGVKDEQIEVIFALGSHRPMTDAEMIQKVGKWRRKKP